MSEYVFPRTFVGFFHDLQTGRYGVQIKSENGSTFGFLFEKDKDGELAGGEITKEQATALFMYLNELLIGKDPNRTVHGGCKL